MASRVARTALLRLLVVVSAPGATIAACDDGPAPADEQKQLPPIPADSAPSCGADQSTPGGFGFHGACCVDVVCRPYATNGECPAPSEVLRGTGSGTCSCGQTTGPYAPPEGKETTGPCCYLAGMIGCDGRPLLVGGRARVALLDPSDAWG